MNRRPVFAGILALIALLLPGAAAEEPDPERGDLLEGVDLLAETAPGPVPRHEDDRPCRVLDGLGRPIAGAIVSGAFDRGKTTDERGFALVHVLHGYRPGFPSDFRRAWTLTARAEGYAPISFMAGPLVHMCRFRLLEPGLRVSGRVLDQAGRPRAAVRIALEWAPERSIGLVTDEEGRFETDLAPARVLSLLARGSGGSRGRLRVIPPATDLTIRLRSAEGSPAEEAPVAAAGLANSGESLSLRLRVVGAGDSDLHLVGVYADGRVFTLPGKLHGDGTHAQTVPAGRLVQVGVSSAFRSVGLRPPFSGEELRFDLTCSASVTGRLLTAAGRAVEEGDVRLRWSGSRRPTRNSRWGGMNRGGPPSDLPAGGLEIDGVGPGRYDLLWLSPSWDEAVVVKRDLVMPNPPRNLDLGDLSVEARSERLVVDVRDAEDHPILGAAVLVYLADRPWARRTDERGRVALPIFDRTPFLLVVEAEGCAPERRTVDPGREGLCLRVVLAPARERSEPVR